MDAIVLATRWRVEAVRRMGLRARSFCSRARCLASACCFRSSNFCRSRSARERLAWQFMNVEFGFFFEAFDESGGIRAIEGLEKAEGGEVHRGFEDGVRGVVGDGWGVFGVSGVKAGVFKHGGHRGHGVHGAEKMGHAIHFSPFETERAFRFGCWKLLICNGPFWTPGGFRSEMFRFGF